jgi:hypothetical protein
MACANAVNWLKEKAPRLVAERAARPSEQAREQDMGY